MKKEMQDKIDRISEKAAIKIAIEPKQLPIWAEEFRSSPNEIIRSSLFSAQVRGKREKLTDTKIFILGDGEIIYDGPELRTFDEDVWLQIMHMARLQPLGEWIEFTPYSMVKALGWVTDGHRPSATHYNRLRECIDRLTLARLRIVSKRLGEEYLFHLISEASLKKHEIIRVQIGQAARDLYGEDYYTQVEWEKRTKLTPTAKRLHGYFASHKKPHPIKIESLYKICNLKSEFKLFKFKLEGYLEELTTHGFLKTFEIKSGLVYVERNVVKLETK